MALEAVEGLHGACAVQKEALAAEEAVLAAREDALAEAEKDFAVRVRIAQGTHQKATAKVDLETGVLEVLRDELLECEGKIKDREAELEVRALVGLSPIACEG